MKHEDESNTSYELQTQDSEYNEAMQDMAVYTYQSHIMTKAEGVYAEILEDFERLEKPSKQINVSSHEEAQYAVGLCAEINKQKSRLTEATRALFKPIKQIMEEIREGHDYVEAEMNKHKDYLVKLVDDWKAQEKAKAEATSKKMMETYGVDIAIMPTTKLQSSSGMSYEKESWVHEVVDEETVPRMYLSVDEKKVKAAIKAGIRDIPGIKIEKQITTIIKRT